MRRLVAVSLLTVCGLALAAGLSHSTGRFDSLWVSANTGNLVNRTDVVHRSIQ